MSAFNTLAATVRCPVCALDGLFEVQFKYGDTWQYEYRLGDRIRWGGNDCGQRSRGVVHVEGVGAPCPNCGTDNEWFEVIIHADEIVAVEPSSKGPA